MSKPKLPYYYKTGSDTYHWEALCSKNNYPEPGWKKCVSPPADSKECNECKSK